MNTPTEQEREKMPHKQLSMFNLPKKKPKQKRPLSNWNYRRRLIHLVTSEPLLSWKSAYKATKRSLKQAETVNNGKSHTTNYRNLPRAINEMRMAKENPDYKHWSIYKIAKANHVNRTTLYRKYREKYQK